MGHTKSLRDALLLTAVFAFPDVAVAQVAGSSTSQQAGDPLAAPGQSAQAAATTREETGDILVTARKREERAQDIPSSITAFSSERIKALGIRDITEVALQTPGFSMQNASRQNEQPFIRGMSANSVFRQSQTASFFVDGIYVSGVGRAIGLDDIERVEVVLGPQAVYFGRATFAGAINYVSKRPEFDGPGGDATATIGEHGLFEIQTGLNAPVSDKFAFRVFGQYHTYNGEYRNQLDGRRVGDEENGGFSASVRLRPIDDLDIIGRVQYTMFDDGHSAVTLYSSALNNNCLPNAAGVRQFYCGKLRNPTEADINLNLNQLYGGGFRKIEQARYSLLATWTIGEFQLNSVTGYNTERDGLSSDGDATRFAPQAGLLQSYFKSYDTDFFHEMRVSSPQDKPIRVVLGGSYFTSNRTDNSLLFPIVSLSNPRHITDVAGFGSISVEPFSGLTATAEGRYQEDKIRVRNTVLMSKFNTFLPRFNLSYKPAQDIMIYGTIAKGDKPGDFNTAAGVPIANQVILEEKLWNYEAGIKSQFLDRRLTLNLTGYDIEWDNQGYQDTVFQRDANNNLILAAGQPRTVVVTVNAGKTRVRGLEFDSSLIILPGWSVRVAYSLIDAKFRDFLSRLPVTYSGVPGQVAGNRLFNSPRNKLTVSSTFERPLGSNDWRLFGSGDVTVRGKQYTDELNTAYIGTLTLVNARLGISNDKFSIYAYGRNLTNSKVPDFATRSTDFNTNVNSYLFTLRPSRSFGATTSVKF